MNFEELKTLMTEDPQAALTWAKNEKKARKAKTGEDEIKTPERVVERIYHPINDTPNGNIRLSWVREGIALIDNELKVVYQYGSPDKSSDDLPPALFVLIDDADMTKQLTPVIEYIPSNGRLLITIIEEDVRNHYKAPVLTQATRAFKTENPGGDILSNVHNFETVMGAPWKELIKAIIAKTPHIEWALSYPAYVSHSLEVILQEGFSSPTSYLTWAYPGIVAKFLLAECTKLEGNEKLNLRAVFSDLTKYKNVVKDGRTLFNFLVEHKTEGEKDTMKRKIVDLLDSALELEMDGYVDLTWSTRRLEEEHDKLGRENALRKLSKTEDKPLNVGEWVKDLQLLPGMECIDTRLRLAIEGHEMKHCVASYEGKIDSGDCIILAGKWEGARYTMELKTPKGLDYEPGVPMPRGKSAKNVVVTLPVIQLRGVRNSSVPKSGEMMQKWMEINPKFKFVHQEQLYNQDIVLG